VHPSAGAGDDQGVALWRLGMTAPGLKLEEGMQLVLALGIPDAPALTSLSAWDAMIADHATTGLTPRAYSLGLLRERLRGEVAGDVGALAQLLHGTDVRIGALNVARQRPGTAKGITFMLIQESTEDAWSVERSDQRRRSTRYANVDVIEARN